MSSWLTSYEREMKAQWERRRAEWAAREELRKTVYLDLTDFYTGGSYQVNVTGEGLEVYSECCAELMSEATARKVHEALGRWLADRDPVST